MTQMQAQRATLRRPENKSSVHEVMPFGVPEIDRKLLGGGLAFGCLHEVVAAGGSAADIHAASLFVAGVLARTRGRILWCVPRRDLFTPALHQAGLDMSRVTFIEAGDGKKVVACMESGLHRGGVTAVVGEPDALGLNEMRRLQLAAEQSGAMGIVLRRRFRQESGEDALAQSLLRSSWRVALSPQSLPEMGATTWRLELMRCRDGEYHAFEVQPCDEEGHIALCTGDYAYPLPSAAVQHALH